MPRERRSARPGLPEGTVLVMGLGEAGQSAARALVADRGAGAVRVWDDSRADWVLAARSSLAELGVAVPPDPEAALEGVAFVVKSPGIPIDNSLLVAASAVGIPVFDELELGWRLGSWRVAAVTGTNGKSTTTTLVFTALSAAGRDPVLAGNVESYRGYSAISSVPRDHGGWVAAEVSSYQLVGTPEFLPDAAVLTNLTPDHLNRHRTMEEYAEAKRRLFVRGDRAVELAVVSADDELGRRLAGEVPARGGRAITFGVAEGGDYRVRSCRSTLRTGRFEFETPEGPLSLETRLPGEHNAANVAAAIALADGLRLEREPVLAAITEMAPLPGRFEPVDEGQPFDVIVDFALSSDAVARTLGTARSLVSPRGGRVIAVMGAIGRSHRPTRERTGRAARSTADHLILCGASMRGEPPMIALEGLLIGAREAEGGELEVVLDRRRAIARALELAEPGDLVAILGRGGLPTMAYDARGGSGPFDDREVTRELLGELGFGPGR
jgi:UDP-N-acetylmuramoyl-L-alanyl-D-glutamate--2,6-diaminopimelate ligase